MEKPKVTAKKPGELQSLCESDRLEELKEGLSLLHSWGVRELEYLPLLGDLLSHEDPEVLRLTLGIMLNFELLPRNEFMMLAKHLARFHELASTQFLALALILGLTGPTPDLVPHLKMYLAEFPEETCDLIVGFGPLAQALGPDLMRIIDLNDRDATWAVVDAIGAIGPLAEQAVPILKELTKHESGVISGRACVALESITGISRETWPRGPNAS